MERAKIGLDPGAAAAVTARYRQSGLHRPHGLIRTRIASGPANRRNARAPQPNVVGPTGDSHLAVTVALPVLRIASALLSGVVYG
jgi:hypothetical protein